MGKIMDAIDAEIIKPRVEASEQEGFERTQIDIQNFYSSGSPRYYQRTGAYGNSPESSGVISKGNGNYEYHIHLNNPEYSTGTPGFPVLNMAQRNGAGILGTPGTWADSAEDIIEAVKGHFS